MVFGITIVQVYSKQEGVNSWPLVIVFTLNVIHNNPKYPAKIAIEFVYVLWVYTSLYMMIA